MLSVSFLWFKRIALYGLFPLAFFSFVFFLGEQFEVGRLSAVAACEESPNKATCIRSKGYLAEPPFYPDLGRRYLGGFARWIGGDLGASYQIMPDDSQSATPAVPAMPTLPVPVIPPANAPVAPSQRL